MFDATYDDLANTIQSPSYQAFHRIIQYAKRGSLPPEFDEHGCTALEEPQEIARVLYHRLSRRKTIPLERIESHDLGR
jgi:hypothetical protein